MPDPSSLLRHRLKLRWRVWRKLPQKSHGKWQNPQSISSSQYNVEIRLSIRASFWRCLSAFNRERQTYAPHSRIEIGLFPSQLWWKQNQTSIPDRRLTLLSNLITRNLLIQNTFLSRAPSIACHHDKLETSNLRAWGQGRIRRWWTKHCDAWWMSICQPLAHVQNG